MFLKSCRGGITIMQCLIFLSLFFIGGVIVDCVRIFMAERKVEAALSTAIRSSMANYHTELIGDYGLFALDTNSSTSPVKADINNYIKMNLQNGTGSFNLHSFELSESKTEVEGRQGILGKDAIREQILEYMKYKAPLTVTRNVLERFKQSGILGKMEYSKAEKNVRNKRNTLKNHIEGVNSKLEKIPKAKESYEIEDLENMNQTLKGAKEDIQVIINKDLKEYREAKKGADDIADNTNKNNEVLDEDSRIRKTSSEFEQLEAQYDKLITKMDSNITRIEDLIIKLKSMEAEIEKLNNIKKSQQATLEELEKEAKNMESKLKGLPEEEKEALRKEIIKQKLQLIKLDAEFEATCSSLLNKNEELNECKKSLRLEEMQKLQVAEPESDDKEKPKEQGEKDLFNKLLSSLSPEASEYLEKINPAWLISKKDFGNADLENKQKLESISKEISKGNPEMEEQEAEKKNDGVLEFLESISKLLSDIGKESVEKIYTVEYIMDKYTYLTSKTERNHFFNKGEVEYILWGDLNQASCLTKTVSSIGGLRFAINTIDYFATSKVPHPVIRLIYAVGRGLVQSCSDVVQLCNGKTVPLTPSLASKGDSFKVSYSDHLRIFLLMQSIGNENVQISNMQQLIQVNILQVEPEFKLKNYNSVIRAEVTVGVNLWFLPFLHLEELGFNQFEGGKYWITRERYQGY